MESGQSSHICVLSWHPTVLLLCRVCCPRAHDIVQCRECLARLCESIWQLSPRTLRVKGRHHELFGRSLS
eukprot:1068455-Amphidinium_carterae.1